MQGNTTEIDERNLLRLDALLSHGYGLSPQLVMRSKGLSIEAKALYGYLSSFAGAGDTAFPSTSRILEELDISKNRFYKIRKELVSWGFISIETTATSAGLRTVYTLPQNPIAIKTEIDEIANRRNEIKSSLVANLHNEDMVSHKGDSESECLQQSAGNEPCRQSEAKAQNRGSNLKPCLQSEDEGCLQSGDKLYIDTNINPKVSIDRSAAHPSDDEGPSDWKVTEGMTDPTQRDDGESDRDANRRDALDAVPDGTYDPLPTVADGYTLSNSEFEAFNHLCSLSIKTVRGAVRNEAAKQYAKRLGEGYSPATIEKAYIDYAEAYRQNNPSPRFAKQLSDWFVKSDGFAYFAKKPVIRTTTATKAMSITSCAEASITGLHLTEFFLVDLQVPLIASWAVISTQKSIKLPSTRTCPCSARSSQSFRIPSKADINVWMSMPQDKPPARSFIFTVRTEAERIIRSAISSWASARWTNEAVSHSPSSRPM